MRYFEDVVREIPPLSMKGGETRRLEDKPMLRWVSSINPKLSLTSRSTTLQSLEVSVMWLERWCGGARVIESVVLTNGSPRFETGRLTPLPTKLCLCINLFDTATEASVRSSKFISIIIKSLQTHGAFIASLYKDRGYYRRGYLDIKED